MRKYSVHGVFYRVQLLKCPIQRTNSRAAGTDERLVDIEKKQLHARIVLRVYVIFDGSRQNDGQFAVFHWQFEAALRLLTDDSIDEGRIRHLIFTLACGT